MGLIKDLEDSLFDSVAGKIERYGFDKRAKAYYAFYKKTPSGRLAFALAFIRHSADVDVTVNVAIRFDELEDLVNEHEDHLKDKQKQNTFSLGAELGNISGVGQKRWTLASLDDVEGVADSIMNAFASIGIPYLEEYSDMETALAALSGDDKAAWLHSPLHDARARRAIGLAFLLGDREKFSEIAAAKTEFLTARNDFGLESFMRLREALDRLLSARPQATSQSN
ncbi:MAG: hypothetical protein WAQ99_09850 [Pyrinomonadaceae bacterium]